MRDKLIELILKSEILCNTCGESSNTYCAEALADHLLANGVVVLDMGEVSTKDRPLITHIAGLPLNDIADLIKYKDKQIQQDINLIKRQKAEIEMLEGEIDKQYEQAEANILGNMADGGTSCHWCISKHRAAVVKEFAEKLKAKLAIVSHISVAIYDHIVYVIDNLVNEMVGEH